jgi:hypothetical protein
VNRWLLAGLATVALVPACTRHTVRLEPIEIKPIHITMDINVKIQKQLQEDFSFMEEMAAPQPEEKKQ